MSWSDYVLVFSISIAYGVISSFIDKKQQKKKEKFLSGGWSSYFEPKYAGVWIPNHGIDCH